RRLPPACRLAGLGWVTRSRERCSMRRIGAGIPLPEGKPFSPSAQAWQQIRPVCPSPNRKDSARRGRPTPRPRPRLRLARYELRRLTACLKKSRTICFLERTGQHGPLQMANLSLAVNPNRKHVWKFARAGGLDQVRFETADD